MPKVDAQGRKKFRAEVLKAPEGTSLEVFRRWVTILVPELVPVTPSLIQQITNPPTLVDSASLEQARIVIEEEQKEAREEARKADIREKRRVNMQKARDAKNMGKGSGKSHHKKKVS
jgi:hypothetical protein